MHYVLIHFLHVVGALGMAAAYAVEAAGLAGLRTSSTADEARAWFRTRRWVLRLGPTSILLILATGLSAVWIGWGWTGWLVVSLGGLVAVALIGGVMTGIPMARIERALESSVGPLSDELRRDIRGRALPMSMTTRVALTLGVALLMVSKPEAPSSAVIMAVAAALGVVVGVALGAGGAVRSRPGGRQGRKTSATTGL
jgi:hypothetical protein